jgi:hypothetical protein
MEASMHAKPATTAQDRYLEQERRRIVPLQEAARLRGESVDYLRKHLRDRFVKRGRYYGMRLADVFAED